MRFARIGVVGAAAFALAVPAGAALKPLALKERLLRTGEFPGFVPQPSKQVVVVTSAASWTADVPPADAAKEAVRLRKLGFAAAAAETLRAPSLPKREGSSTAIQFRSPAAARQDLGYTARNFVRIARAPVKAFAVAGIPGARGFAASRSNGVTYTVLFADGVFRYDVGAFTPDRNGKPTSVEVAAAALKLYTRVRGHPAPTTIR